MKTLQNYLINEDLSNPAISTLVSVLKQKLKSSWFCLIDNSTFKNIQETFSQVHPEDKKGTQWKLIIDETFLDKMIMVSLKKGEWRYAMDKEIYGKTASNYEKDFLKAINKYEDFDFGEDFGPVLFAIHTFYIINEYVKVDSPNNSWKLVFATINNEYKPIRIDTVGKQWGFDENIVDADIRCKVSYTLASNANIPNHRERYHVDDSVMKYVKSHFTQVDVNEYDANRTWSRIGYGVQSNSDIMACAATKQWRERSWKDDSTISDIDKKLNDIVKRSKYGAYSLSEDLYKYIKSTFDQDLKGVGGRWYTVYYNDSKYGRFMVNLDKKLWRKPSFDEFYGGAVVD